MYKASLVVLGNGTQGLGIIRSAGEMGIPIIQINDKYFSAGRFSKYISKYIKLESNLLANISFDKNAEESLTNTILKLPVSYPSVIMGTNEDIIAYLNNNKTVLKEKYFLPENNYEVIFDKYLFNKTLPIENQIETYLGNSELYSKKGDSNFILKGRKGNSFKNFTGKKAFFLKDLNDEERKKIANQLGEENLIIQKVIEGDFPVQSVCTTSENGKIKGLFIYEKLRQHPNKFGTGTYLRSIESKDVLKIAEVILDKIKYTGISEIEFVLDPTDNKYKVIEMNPRTWKSINFATQCNQNIVKKYIDFVIGKEVINNNNNTYIIDKYWADIFADISQMIRERRVFKYRFSEMYECTWERKDPLPFIASIFFLPFIAFKI